MKEVYEFLTKTVKIKDNDTIVVACSGGPDSMFLLKVLMDLRTRINMKLICAHVNHNVRVESAAEEKFLKEYCLENNVIFEAMTIEKYGEDNFHNEARKIRYYFFEELIKKYNAQYLMTAHHGDDLIETVLMRIVRGSTLKGYAGFEQIVEKNNYTLVRPLVYMTKKEIEDYDIKNKIPYVTDMSNFKPKYTRNRYRKEVLPFLKEEDINVHKKFLKFSTTLLEYDKYINQVLDKNIRKIYNNNVLNIQLFLENETLIQKKIVFYILENLYSDNLNQIDNEHVDAIIKLIKSKKSNGFINLPGNYRAIKEYDKLKFLKEIDDYENYLIELDEMAELPDGHVIKRVSEEEKNDNNVCRLLSSEIKLPLYIRTRHLGDKIALRKIDGRKKVKDVFIDCKVPIMKRDSWPIVVDSEDNIIWIPGLKKSKLSKHKNEIHDIILRYD